jgi:hypothetical protein
VSLRRPPKLGPPEPSEPTRWPAAPQPVAGVVRPDPGSARPVIRDGELALVLKGGRVYVLQAPDRYLVSDEELAQLAALRREDETWPDGLVVGDLPAGGVVVVAGDRDVPGGRACYLGVERTAVGWVLERIS